MDKTELSKFLEDELKMLRGGYFPVKSGILRRMVMKKARCSDLHPNPNDVFCDPKVGPCSRIISEYQQKFINDIRRDTFFENEPVIIERLHPNGYMLINGHHRWAAARGIGQKTIPAKLVNLMHEADISKILSNSMHTKRAALDLDEVVFAAEEDTAAEPQLNFPWNRVYGERLRRGVPALFHFLAKNGYDIWLYSFKYYSFDYIQRFFKRYHVRITGVISAVDKRSDRESGRSIEKRINEKYERTLHIDRSAVLEIARGRKQFRDIELTGEPGEWSREVMEAVESLERGKEAGA